MINIKFVLFERTFKKINEDSLQFFGFDFDQKQKQSRFWYVANEVGI